MVNNETLLMSFEEWEQQHKQKYNVINRIKQFTKSISIGETLYYIKQRLIGVISIILAIAFPLIEGELIIGSLFLLLIGIPSLFTKEKVYTNNYINIK